MGLMTSSTFECGETEFALQQKCLGDVNSILCGQITTMLTHPDMAKHPEEMANLIAHKLSCLSSVAKGYDLRQRPDAVSVFEQTAGTVVAAVSNVATVSEVRLKTVVFLHRMVKCLGPRSMELIQVCFGSLLTHADTKDFEPIAQVLNQAMVEFKSEASPLVDFYFEAVLGKSVQLQASIEDSAGQLEATHIAAERAAQQRIYFVFLQHISTFGCHSVLISPSHMPMLETILNTALQGSLHVIHLIIHGILSTINRDLNVHWFLATS
jgi:Exportin-T